jgi:hypothetical protein
MIMNQGYNMTKRDSMVDFFREQATKVKEQANRIKL